MRNKLLIVPILLLISCNKESHIALEEIAPPEVEVSLEPGTRTSKGGLILNQDFFFG